MELIAAEKLAKELMAQFGLTPNWVFRFNNSKRQFGCCLHRSIYVLGYRADGEVCGTIVLSRVLVIRNDREQVEDTIRHEIAHALCEPRQGHGDAWKAMCKRTGAKPERCYKDEVNTPNGDWSATCGGCGKTHYKFRQPRQGLRYGPRYCAYKDCKAKNPPEWGQRFNPLCKLVYRHKDALPEFVPSAEQRRKAIEATKAALKAAEREPGAELVYQCAKCDRKSISFHSTCPVCEGDMVPEAKLRAEKEELKRKIAELESKLGAKI